MGQVDDTGWLKLANTILAKDKVNRNEERTRENERVKSDEPKEIKVHLNENVNCWPKWKGKVRNTNCDKQSTPIESCLHKSTNDGFKNEKTRSIRQRTINFDFGCEQTETAKETYKVLFENHLIRIHAN